MSLQLADFTGDVIYLDTMLPYALFRGMTPIVAAFFARIESGAVIAYTSVLTFDELAYRLLLALVKDNYSGSPLDRLRDDEERLIAEFAPAVTLALDRLRGFPNLRIVEVTAADVESMVQAMADYAIRPRDALHFAAMQSVGCHDLASRDGHFDRITQVRRYSP
jgi:predicted nucleic acid-binding protein